MPLPARLKPAKTSRQTLKVLADRAKEILSRIDTSTDKDDEGLKTMIADWNGQVFNPQRCSDFRDFFSWTSAKDFTRMAFYQE